MISAADLLSWYDIHRRVLPWRALAGVGADPYRVWLSEIMLQQTTVAAVGAYFRAFTARWPTVADLAAAPLDDVLAAWAGLGYYARARNLHKCARVVVQDFGGLFPGTEAELRGLPGVGAYTAGAIAAIAFDQRAAAVDGNVERVMARVYAVETPLPAAKAQLRALAEALVPEARAGDFAQAAMDLGATICTPRNPKCLACPWRDGCAGRKAGIAEQLPRKPARVAKPRRFGVAYWLTNGRGEVLLRRRPPTGLLGGMLEVPSSAWTDAAPDAHSARQQAPEALSWRPLPGVVKHVFTHFSLELTVHTASTSRVVKGQWVPQDQLAGIGLPSLMLKVARHAQRHTANAER
jgi:A/G-specific adenine glycosylase